MIKISDTVQSIIENDPVALECLQKGILNMSAYAQTIHKLVESITMKEVMHGSLVVALNRLEKKYQVLPELRPYIKLKNITVQGSLAEITYEKTRNSLRSLSTVNTLQVSDNAFFAVTEGLAEITIICSEEALKSITSRMNEKYKAVIHNLIAVSVTFPSSYMDVPNSIYTLISALAARRINLVEVVSTYTELSFIISEIDLENTLSSLRKYLHISI